MMAAILNLAILDSAILVFPLHKNDCFSHSCLPTIHKKTSLIHSDSNLMMAAILNSAMLN